jgi:addiction module RelE/StbE family toxin
MKYHYHRTIEFRESFKRLTQKNKALQVRLAKKIRQILDNPFIGVPKRHELKHARGSHVDPYVIVYVVRGDTITFVYVDHHDYVYQKATEILKKWELEFTN